ncbi:MAG: hypothetical protein LBD77_04515 [Bifidobacteriaceae bacterium]|jgi:beta-mannosidase|nr:hypothetical protein [Bifidobacteriaceae bacterium]
MNTSTETELAALPLSGSNWELCLPNPVAVPEVVAAAFAEGGSIPARVPGCVHDDLLAAGLIPDPFLGDNEAACVWIGHQLWRYQAQLPPVLAERVDLVADGLDTVAELSVDGAVVGAARDQHRRFRFDVTSKVGAGGRLRIDFSPVYDRAAAVAAAVGPLPTTLDLPFPYVRKMTSNFGWDWGPAVVTAGIWKDIRLETWATARLAHVRPLVSLPDPASRLGVVDVAVEVERTPARTSQVLVCSVEVAGRRASLELPPGTDAATLALEVPDVDLWWPHSLGGQPLYPLIVSLCDRDGRQLDARRTQVGFRSIILKTEVDDIGRGFTFSVNGRDVFATGFNWIPNDTLVARVSEDDYRARLADARDAGAIMLRVWGGGIFEKDEFYNVADEFGLMVWQDFLFGNAGYPETDEFAAEVEAEVRDNIERLVSHPSLALWNGGNEALWGFEEWGWRDVLQGRPWGRRYYLDLLPRLVAELDPTRPYWPGSPASEPVEAGAGSGVAANDPDHGCFHSWVAWNQTDYRGYATSAPRFVSEFGWCAPAAHATLAEALGTDHLASPRDPVLEAHNKAADGPAKINRWLERHFSSPRDTDQWHYLAQILQARAVGFGVDHWRGCWPRTAGALIWQLNDCWPAVSWAAVDSAGRRKPLWHQAKAAFATVRGTVDFGALGPVLAVSNFGLAAWAGQARIRRVRADGLVCAQWRRQVRVEPGEVLRVDLPGALAHPAEAARELLIAEVAGGRQVLSFVPDKDFDYPPPAWSAEVRPLGEDCLVGITAQSLLRDLWLQADRLRADAAVDSGPVTLLPGETHQWRVRGAGALIDVAELRYPVLMSVGDVEAGRAGRGVASGDAVCDD